jgi:hypothetical protein
VTRAIAIIIAAVSTLAIGLIIGMVFVVNGDTSTIHGMQGQLSATRAHVAQLARKSQGSSADVITCADMQAYAQGVSQAILDSNGVQLPQIALPAHCINR